MKYGVYKVLRLRENAKWVDINTPIYTSAFVHGSATLKFQVEQQTKSETPIFVYTELKYAMFAASVSPELVVFKGVTETEPFLIRTKSPMILFATDFLSQQVVNDFWKYSCDLTRVLNGFDIKPPTNDMFGVYDFTPLHIVR
jgi:hypothetical protein